MTPLRTKAADKTPREAGQNCAVELDVHDVHDAQSGFAVHAAQHSAGAATLLVPMM